MGGHGKECKRGDDWTKHRMRSSSSHAGGSSSNSMHSRWWCFVECTTAASYQCAIANHQLRKLETQGFLKIALYNTTVKSVQSKACPV